MGRISGTCRWKPLRASVERVSATCWSFLGGVGEWAERIGREYDWRLSGLAEELGILEYDHP